MKSITIRFLFLATALFGVLGCSNSEETEQAVVEEVPSYVLSTEKMSDVMTDLHIIDATINLGYINQSALIYNKAKLQDSVFFQHKVKRADFDSSVVWYGKHIEDLKSIYDDVTFKLNKKHAEAQR
jgi:hypothetical protein